MHPEDLEDNDGLPEYEPFLTPASPDLFDGEFPEDDAVSCSEDFYPADDSGYAWLDDFIFEDDDDLG